MSSQYIEIFQDFRTILCICPCCGEIVRISDLHLQYRDEAPKTWLDEYESKLRVLDARCKEFDVLQSKIRDEAIARGRRRVIEAVNMCIDEGISCLDFDPYDIKSLFSPIDFVVFNGMNHREELDDIVFLGKKSRDKVRKSLEKTINDENYDFKIARVRDEGSVDFE